MGLGRRHRVPDGRHISIFESQLGEVECSPILTIAIAAILNRSKPSKGRCEVSRHDDPARQGCYRARASDDVTGCVGRSRAAAVNAEVASKSHR